jgi:hypothetical protein
MSATEKLISIVYEHKELLGFLNDNHPTILDEWKNKGAELAVRTPQPTDVITTIPERIGNDSQKFVR